MHSPASPTWITRLSDTITPVALFQRIEATQSQAFLFESADGDKRMARFSFMGLDPVLTVSLKNRVLTVTEMAINKTTEQVLLPAENPMAVLQDLIHQHLPAIAPLPPALNDIPFTAGWAGYFGYGMSQYFEAIPQQTIDPLAVPDCALGLYDTVIVFDHLYRRLHFISYKAAEQAAELWQSVEADLFHESRQFFSNVLPVQALSENILFEKVSTAISKPAFCSAVNQIKAYITEGQAFQIVLAQRFYLAYTASALNAYRLAQAINPSPYAYFLKFPSFCYLGSSPETFLSCQNKALTLKALAGTKPRGLTSEADKALAAALKADTKEMAEHSMLVDLARNDVGRISEPGTVAVGEIAQIIRYSHVMHLATAVTGQLTSEKTGYDAIQSCFPRGTVSGAPKIRAMTLLSQLEPEQRGVYSGLVGYIDHAGNTDSAIAIRSTLIKDGQAHVHAGAGVVYYSVAESEYEETRNKAKSILHALILAGNA
ncbi:MAG: anthranilate synthase component I family protein [Cyanobacteria bacterium P01_H01_bin.74]